MLAAMYRRILIPIDGSSTSESGLDEAIRLAFLHDGVIRLICIVQPQPSSGAPGANCYFPAEIQTLLFEHAAELLRNAATRVRANCIAVDSALVEAGERSFEECLAAEARAWEADLIVIGAHRSRDVRRMPMASPAPNLPRGVAVPLLLVREAAPKAVQPLVNSWR
ncbi:universal stress protein [Achromobacter sp. 77]|uniref:universal stress protein n=1 Tax=Achromobacter sp. 77 TaxID=2756133 RepID=UPI001D02F35F|nr:universal stress protein [Achromobacter sp. 77]